MDDLTRKINMYIRKKADETNDQELRDMVDAVEAEDDAWKLPFDVKPAGSFNKMSKDEK